MSARARKYFPAFGWVLLNKSKPVNEDLSPKNKGERRWGKMALVDTKVEVKY